MATDQPSPGEVLNPVGFLTSWFKGAFAGPTTRIYTPEERQASAERLLASNPAQKKIAPLQRQLAQAKAEIAARQPPSQPAPTPIPQPGVPPRVQPAPPPSQTQPSVPGYPVSFPGSQAISSPYYAAIIGKEVVSAGQRRLLERFGSFLSRGLYAIEGRSGLVGVALLLAHSLVPKLLDIGQSAYIKRQVDLADMRAEQQRKAYRREQPYKAGLKMLGKTGTITKLPGHTISPGRRPRVAAPPRKTALTSSQAAKVLLEPLKVTRARLPSRTIVRSPIRLKMPTLGVPKPMDPLLKFIFDAAPGLITGFLSGKGGGVAPSALLPTTPTIPAPSPGIPPGLDPGTFFQSGSYLQPSLFVNPQAGQGQCECAPKKKKKPKPRTVCYEGKFRQTRKRTIQTSRKEIPCR